jgi:hypothetical protein
MTNEEFQAHMLKSPEHWYASKPKPIGKPMRLDVWCPDCSSITSQIFIYREVFVFPSSEGPRIRCIQCLAEGWNRGREALRMVYGAKP